MTTTPSNALRWFAVSVFFLISALNYLDRLLLAALAPELQREFHLSLDGYGYLISAFSIAYALSSPLMGLMIDRLGLNLGSSLCVGVWSIAGAATGFAHGFTTLLLTRGVLGMAEGGGIPAAGKASALYLEPGERALGAAASQVGLSLGGIVAPLLAAWASRHYGWRSAFVITGVAGLVWIPLWWIVARQVPPPARLTERSARISIGGMLASRAFWGMVCANILSMAVYSLWTNWTTIFFVTRHGLSAADANQRFAWIPPALAAFGGFAGGWAALWLIGAGVPVVAARLRIALAAALVLLVNLVVPGIPWPGWAALAISLSFFCSTALSVNVYSLPLDVFGAGRAAFAVSALTASYGLLQTVISPAIGWLVRNQGFGVVCMITGLLPLAAVGLLWGTVRRA